MAAGDRTPNLPIAVFAPAKHLGLLLDPSSASYC